MLKSWQTRKRERERERERQRSLALPSLGLRQGAAVVSARPATCEERRSLTCSGHSPFPFGEPAPPPLTHAHLHVPLLKSMPGLSFFKVFHRQHKKTAPEAPAQPQPHSAKPAPPPKSGAVALVATAAPTKESKRKESKVRES